MRATDHLIAGEVSDDRDRPASLAIQDRELRSVVDKYVSTRHLRHRVVDHESWNIEAIAFSPDGRWMVTAAEGLTLWDVTSGQCLWTREVEFGRPGRVAVATGGKDVLAVAVNDHAMLFELLSGRLLRVFPDYYAYVQAVAFARHAGVLLTASTRVTLWEVESGKWLGAFAEGRSLINDVTLSFSGQLVATAGQDRTVRLWDPTTGRCFWTYAGHSDEVLSVATTQDGSHLISGSRDGTVRLLDMTTGREIKTLVKDSVPIASVMTAAGGGILVTRTVEGLAWVLDARDGRPIQSFSGVAAVAPTPDGGSLAIGRTFPFFEAQRDVYLCDLQRQSEPRRLRCHTSGVHQVAVVPHGATMAVSIESDPFNLFDLTTGERHAGFEKASAPVTCALPPDGRFRRSFLPVLNSPCNIFNGRSLLPIRMPHRLFEPFEFLALSRDGVKLVTAGQDIKLWDLPTGKRIGSVATPFELLAGMLTPDGRQVITVTDDGQASLWDLATGRLMETLVNLSADLKAAAISPNGRTVVASYQEGDGKLWDLRTGGCVCVCNGLRGRFHEHGFSADGYLLATVHGADASALWDLRTGKLLRRFESHRGGTYGIDLTPDGRRVITGGWDHTVKVWDATTGTLLATYHNLDHGFLWTTPADSTAPSGWLWTDREALVQVFECNADGTDPAFLAPDDPRRANFLKVFNNQQMVAARLHDLAKYRLVAASHRDLVEGMRRIREREVRALLPEP